MKTVVFDIETTGLPPKDADYKIQFMEYPYIVTMAWKINDRPTREYIINQENREIPEHVSKIHGITTEMAMASPYTLKEVLSEFIIDALGSDFAIGHNVFFDSSTVKANVLRMAQDGVVDDLFYPQIEDILHKDRRVDTMKSTIKFCNIPGPRGAKWPKLTELYDKLFPGETFDAHSSGSDVEATHKCYIELKRLGIL